MSTSLLTRATKWIESGDYDNEQLTETIDRFSQQIIAESTKVPRNTDHINDLKMTFQYLLSKVKDSNLESIVERPNIDNIVVSSTDNYVYDASSLTDPEIELQRPLTSVEKSFKIRNFLRDGICAIVNNRIENNT